jgi:hypothetical protein
MKGDLKMVINGQNKPELYDVETDPAERRTLSARFPDQLQAMKEGLDAWLATVSEAARQKRPPPKAGAATTAAAEGKD